MKPIATLVLLVAIPASAQVGTVARELIEQGVETVARSAARDAAKELAEAGGRAGVREILEKAAAEGGETLVRKTAAIGAEQGPAALRAIARSPAKMVDAIENVAADLRPAAIRAAEREPAAVANLVNRYGADALEAAARHPGVGTTLAEKLGPEGLTAARTLTTDQAVVIGRHADEIAALAPAQRASFFARLRSNAAGVVSFLESHPKTLLTTAGVAVLLGAKDELLGPGGGPQNKPPGLVHRIWSDTLGVASKPIGMISTILVALVALWACGKAWVTLKRRRAQARAIS
jgi:hypothetical protein